MADDPNFADFSKLTADMYRQWEKGMSSWWDQVLEDPEFLGAMGQSLSARSRARKTWEKAVDDSLEAAHLPTRSDLVRVARIATLLEEQVLRIEDAMLDMKDRLERTEKEALQARIEAAEARLALQEKLDGIDAKLDALKPRGSTRKKKSES